MVKFNPAFLKNYYGEFFSALTAFLVSTSLFLYSNLRFPNDDQFILYRYIDNLAAGHGFVFNLGEKVLGSTTPLFTLIGGLLKWTLPLIETPNLVAVLNITFFSLSAIGFWRLSRKFLSVEYTFVAVGIFVFSLARMIPEGMETPLFIFLTIFSLDCLLVGKYKISSIFLALSILTRPDAGLVGLLFAIFWWQKIGWRKMIEMGLIVSLVALPWLIFSTWYFGSFIPQSLQTKIHSNEIVFQTNYQALKVQLSHLSRLYWGKIIDPNSIPVQVIVNLLPFLGLVFWGLYKKMNKDNWLIAAVPLLYLISFSISNPVMFPWYLSETEPFWIILSIWGLVALSAEIKIPWLKMLLVLVVLTGPVWGWYQLLTTPSQGTKTALFEAGYYLKSKKLGPTETVGMSNIGITSYIGQTKTVDFIGLVNDYAVNFYPVDRTCLGSELYVIPPKLIQFTEPDWLVAGDGEMDKCFVESPWFTKKYRLDYRTGGTNIYHKINY